MTRSKDALTRGKTRKMLEECKLTRPTQDQIWLLHGILYRELMQFAGMRDTLRPARVRARKRSIECKSNYFNNRQAYDFEPDGFCGIAGWADDRNVQPFLRALHKWAEEVTGHVT